MERRGFEPPLSACQGPIVYPRRRPNPSAEASGVPNAPGASPFSWHAYVKYIITKSCKSSVRVETGECLSVVEVVSVPIPLIGPSVLASPSGEAVDAASATVVTGAVTWVSLLGSTWAALNASMSAVPDVTVNAIYAFGLLILADLVGDVRINVKKNLDPMDLPVRLVFKLRLYGMVFLAGYSVRLIAHSWIPIDAVMGAMCIMQGRFLWGHVLAFQKLGMPIEPLKPLARQAGIQIDTDKHEISTVFVHDPDPLASPMPGPAKTP